MSYVAVIPAAGLGKRMGYGYNKVFIEIGKQPVINMTIEQFERDERCSGIYLAARDEEVDILKEAVLKYTKVKDVVSGGTERQHSIYNVLKIIPPCDYVMIHDGARPFITQDVLNRLYDEVLVSQAVICGVPSKDTVKKVENEKIVSTIPRDTLFIAHTPQAFSYDLIIEAHEFAMKQQLDVTDDASMVEVLGRDVSIVQSTYDNIKITTQEDLYTAQAILKRRDDMR
jgi:2-C-methyl-D-erythritol 4-phosphate cytidylyltransferase